MLRYQILVFPLDLWVISGYGNKGNFLSCRGQKVFVKNGPKAFNGLANLSGIHGNAKYIFGYIASSFTLTFNLSRFEIQLNLASYLAVHPALKHSPSPVHINRIIGTQKQPNIGGLFCLYVVRLDPVKFCSKPFNHALFDLLKAFFFLTLTCPYKQDLFLL